VSRSTKYVYHMDGVSKTYPGGKKCFENIRLSFLPGVKIGVVGVNGAGKSTLLKDHGRLHRQGFHRRGLGRRGCKVGYLPQEPRTRRQPDVRENVMLGVKAKKDKLDRFNELAMNYSDETADEMAQLQDEIDARTCGISTPRSTWRWRRCAARPTTPMSPTSRAGNAAASRSASCCSKRPTCCCSTSRPTTSTPNHRLAAAAPDRLQGHLPDRHPRPLFPRRHHRLDPRTRPRPGIPYEGNYSAWLEQKAKRLEQEAREDKSKQKTLERELEWMRQGAKARQAKQKARINAYDELAGQSERESRPRPDRHPQRPAPGRQGDRGREPQEGLWATSC
jgi:ATPase subunit of ABC transporter with duplicated ATPase domains